ncbi:MAG: hypothetical protein QF375_09275 [Arenicellales bacterium]|jgi:hypothetical protein|nr:hypothetical protein [Arenicellales bacterium]MDP6948190.1 hypothetical protein [Arenicellales bacterium]|tara:strand:+ start:6023 stop:6409 length:387 start_codon:yes stop_codon:yes gene_type:complete
MRRFHISALVVCWALALTPVGAQARSVITDTLLEAHLVRGDWPARRSGQALLALAPVKALLERFTEQPGQRITIRYPGGDSGNAWALELRTWLVALGVPTGFVILEPGSGTSDALLLLLEQARDPDDS